MQLNEGKGITYLPGFAISSAKLLTASLQEKKLNSQSYIIAGINSNTAVGAHDLLWGTFRNRDRLPDWMNLFRTTRMTFERTPNFALWKKFRNCMFLFANFYETFVFFLKANKKRTSLPANIGSKAWQKASNEAPSGRDTVFEGLFKILSVTCEIWNILNLLLSEAGSCHIDKEMGAKHWMLAINTSWTAAASEAWILGLISWADQQPGFARGHTVTQIIQKNASF